MTEVSRGLLGSSACQINSSVERSFQDIIKRRASVWLTIVLFSYWNKKLEQNLHSRLSRQITGHFWFNYLRTPYDTLKSFKSVRCRNHVYQWSPLKNTKDTTHIDKLVLNETIFKKRLSKVKRTTNAAFCKNIEDAPIWLSCLLMKPSSNKLIFLRIWRTTSRKCFLLLGVLVAQS